MSQAELGRKLGLSRSTISMYEKGNREPGFEIVEQIAKALSTTPAYLMGWNDNPKDDKFDPFSDALKDTWDDEEERQVIKNLYHLGLENEKKTKDNDLNPKLTILYKRSRSLTDKQLDIVNSIVNEMVSEDDR